MSAAVLKPLTLPIVLGCAGLLPFLAAFGCYSLGIPLLGFSAELIFVSYSAVILSFLAGAVWGRGLSAGGGLLDQGGLLFSNFIALLGWFAFLISWVSAPAGLILLGIGYLLMVMWDLVFFDTAYSGVKPGYRRLRLALTLVVVATHIAMTALQFRPLI